MKFKPKPIPLRMPSWESTELPQQEAGFVPTHHAYPETPLWCPTGAFQGLTEQILLTALPTPPTQVGPGPEDSVPAGGPPQLPERGPTHFLNILGAATAERRSPGGRRRHKQPRPHTRSRRRSPHQPEAPHALRRVAPPPWQRNAALGGSTAPRGPRGDSAHAHRGRRVGPEGSA